MSELPSIVWELCLTPELVLGPNSGNLVHFSKWLGQIPFILVMWPGNLVAVRISRCVNPVVQVESEGLHSFFQVPVIDSSSTKVEAYDLHSIFSAYIKRNGEWCTAETILSRCLEPSRSGQSGLIWVLKWWHHTKKDFSEIMGFIQLFRTSYLKKAQTQKKMPL